MIRLADSSGMSLAVRPAYPSDRPAIERLMEGIHRHIGWSGPCRPLAELDRATAESRARVAIRGDEVLGFGWISTAGGSSEIGLALHPELVAGQVRRELLGAIARQARDEGLSSFQATLAFEDEAALDALHEAGYRVVSAFSVGGATRLSLALKL